MNCRHERSTRLYLARARAVFEAASVDALSSRDRFNSVEAELRRFALGCRSLVSQPPTSFWFLSLDLPRQLATDRRAPRSIDRWISEASALISARRHRGGGTGIGRCEHGHILERPGAPCDDRVLEPIVIFDAIPFPDDAVDLRKHCGPLRMFLQGSTSSPVSCDGWATPTPAVTLRDADTHDGPADIAAHEFERIIGRSRRGCEHHAASGAHRDGERIFRPGRGEEVINSDNQIAEYLRKRMASVSLPFRRSTDPCLGAYAG